MPDSKTTCGCSAEWQRPKANGTCATCGGWLPGEQPKPLPWSMGQSEGVGILPGGFFSRLLGSPGKSDNGPSDATPGRGVDA